MLASPMFAIAILISSRSLVAAEGGKIFYFQDERIPWSGQGDGTSYSKSTEGNACLLPQRHDQRFAAFSGKIWNRNLCGACARVTSLDTGRSIDVQLINECPECLEGSLDLSDAAFAAIDDPVKGRVQIRWHLVDCHQARLVPENYYVRYKTGTTQYWGAVQAVNIGKPIVGMSVRPLGSGAPWKPLVRTDYNFWSTCKNGGPLGKPPLEFRKTFNDGEHSYAISHRFNTVNVKRDDPYSGVPEVVRRALFSNFSNTTSFTDLDQEPFNTPHRVHHVREKMTSARKGKAGHARGPH
ncbi:uncharacterized protein L969DRAFT_58727 [Mixia osmundae IAM 14324]|uniref:Barwin domain-containing protein n=1 Tax=Mixia osmundae (strain CBS 9802 / IAM 14324 / JCM 22182 / KY 12970) TaxID=764103 RepID=G7DYK2_MIXOS|nr:uncharacterized protein L969DRAFT_58727 [Mixia osmundae IAM 14324]KEI41561.1 hypothetical protein L969DRAFT_58727 [Mixia osmundae IAM 14324]GAA95662.1 hypothetical protein E5Q_02318 [Mixia osmundae IAM 14324]